MSSSEIAVKISDGEKPPSLWQKFKANRPGLWVLPVLATLVVGVIFIIVGPVFSSFRSDASAESSAKAMEMYIGNTTGSKLQFKCPPIINDQSEGYIRVGLDVSQLLAAQASAKMVVTPDPRGYFDSGDDSLLLLDTNDTNLYGKIGRTRFGGTWLDSFEKTEITDFLAYANGYANYAFYPMDSYITKKVVGAYLVRDIGGANVTLAVNLCITFNNPLPTFDAVISGQSAAVLAFPPEAIDRGTYSSATFTITFNRTKGTRFFSIFIVILMWVLSGMMLTLVVDHVFLRPREPAPPTMGVCIALLFALPAVRGTQPEVPPIGVAVDVLGFFWNMSITAVSASIMMTAFMGYHKHTPMK